jgi:hypothetical protein
VVRPNDPDAAALQIGDPGFVRWRTGDCLVLPADRP